eukprot:2150310-Rhodomonas_salina.1
MRNPTTPVRTPGTKPHKRATSTETACFFWHALCSRGVGAYRGMWGGCRPRLPKRRNFPRSTPLRPPL